MLHFGGFQFYAGQAIRRHEKESISNGAPLKSRQSELDSGGDARPS